MEGKQTIKCTVESCLYNDIEKGKCSLEEIHVAPCSNCDTQEADESMCSSYECCYDDEDE